MLQQLRIYRIAEGKYEQFLRAWLEGVYTTRLMHGWGVQAWAARDRGELIWILSRDCTLDEWQELEMAYYSSPERKALDPDPAQWIVDGEERWIEGLAMPLRSEPPRA